MLEATYFGFLVIVFNVHLYRPVTIAAWCPLVFRAFIMQDRDLSEYNPSGSSTSKIISCSHQLCALGPDCPNPKQQCPYTINYYSDDTSTSGFLVEDVLHLLPGNSDVSNKSVKAPVVIGCGNKQTGGYLSGVAPDGLLGLGLGEISVGSFLAKAGYIRNSFSLCFNEDDSGRLLFGDQGIAGQQTTPFLPLHGKNLTYIVGVDACCIESSCLENPEFQMLVDSGSSFSFLPAQIFEKVANEFDRQVNAPKSSFEGYPWKYCYKSSPDGVPKLPSFTLKFATSKSFVVKNPVFVIYGTQGAVGFCLAVQAADGDIGTIGQNFMTGYQIVFDRENFKLGWSESNCKDLSDRAPLNPTGNNSSSNSLPTAQQQSAPNSRAVSPAVAGKTPSESSAKCLSCLAKLFSLMLIAHLS
ncbi:aspartic proteinase-like protein 1 isoform X2 [Salvia splendens]|uniref:aspartic proteinase-like protein 1 isoform X2 n=1 Tax=Salvia splendens TaxID=180675 RepID=UPI001C270A48|nr:aspartic proteinase-like protein 1 isoform X2 [Salvia splendens]